MKQISNSTKRRKSKINRSNLRTLPVKTPQFLEVGELVGLVNHREEICVSFFLPQHKDVETFKQSFLDLWQDAYQLLRKNHPLEQIRESLGEIHIEALASLRNPDFDTLCLFVSKKHQFLVHLDKPFSERVVVDTSFYLKPLVESIYGQDQYWLLHADDEGVRVDLGSLSGSVTFQILKRKSGRRNYLKSLHRIAELLQKDHRPWFIAGGYFEVSALSERLKSTPLKRPPSAHILHRISCRIQESAREVIRIRHAHEESFRERQLRNQVHRRDILLEPFEISEAIRKGEIQSITVCKDRIHTQVDAFTKLIYRDTHRVDLEIDDLLEVAMTHQVPVQFVPGLEKRFALPIVAFRKNLSPSKEKENVA